MLNVHKIIPQTKVEGPGTRFCIWVQGCHNRCEGCFAVDTWDPGKGTMVPEKSVIAQILAVRENIEGVTFLGGEPMEQADCLAVIAQAAQTVGLSIITFTGRKYEDLLAENRPGVLRLLSLTDILIDGEFQKDAPEDTRPLVGSQNQRFIFLTNRYCESDIAQMRNAFEVRIDETGRFQINGMGDIRKLQTYLNQYRG